MRPAGKVTSLLIGVGAAALLTAPAFSQSNMIYSYPQYPRYNGYGVSSPAYHCGWLPPYLQGGPAYGYTYPCPPAYCPYPPGPQRYVAPPYPYPYPYPPTPPHHAAYYPPYPTHSASYYRPAPFSPYVPGAPIMAEGPGADHRNTDMEAKGESREKKKSYDDDDDDRPLPRSSRTSTSRSRWRLSSWLPKLWPFHR